MRSAFFSRKRLTPFHRSNRFARSMLNEVFDTHTHAHTQRYLALNYVTATDASTSLALGAKSHQTSFVHAVSPWTHVGFFPGSPSVASILVPSCFVLCRACRLICTSMSSRCCALSLREQYSGFLSIRPSPPRPPYSRALSQEIMSLKACG